MGKWRELKESGSHGAIPCFALAVSSLNKTNLFVTQDPIV